MAEPPRSGSLGSEKVAPDINELRHHSIHQSEVLVDKNLMSDAFQGENREHEMGVWEAVKNYPMACLWAFVFCFTIVSGPAACALTTTRS